MPSVPVPIGVAVSTLVIVPALPGCQASANQVSDPPAPTKAHPQRAESGPGPTPESKNGLEVTARARQWIWTFSYPDGFESSELVLPAHHTIHLCAHAKDTGHYQLSIPALDVELPVSETEKSEAMVVTGGPTEGVVSNASRRDPRNAEMRTPLRVVSAEEFERWLQARPGAWQKDLGDAWEAWVEASIAEYPDPPDARAFVARHEATVPAERLRSAVVRPRMFGNPCGSRRRTWSRRGATAFALAWLGALVFGCADAGVGEQARRGGTVVEELRVWTTRDAYAAATPLACYTAM